MKNYYLLLILVLSLLISCKEEIKREKKSTTKSTLLSVEYAEGFTVQQFPDYTLLEVTKAFPGAQKTFKYALVSNTNIQKSNSEIGDSKLPDLLRNQELDAIIQIPLKNIVVTSTTHIPSLEMLGVAETLKGFPNLDYVSSPLSRKRIENGDVRELGQNESLNTELAIELNPDAVITFGVEGENKSVNSLQRAGIPVLYNGDWVEKDPLGKAEWIKFFGVLYGKEKEADSIFNHIKNQYLAIKNQLNSVTKQPSVLSGAMYKDVWYVPNGDSWQAKILKDAGANYLWEDTEGTGSSALSLEAVLDKAQTADFWIAPAQYTSYTKLEVDNPVYAQFDAFKKKNVYTFAKAKGATGGLLYYEVAPNRPDLVLRDLAKILHPELITLNFTFFSPLDE